MPKQDLYIGLGSLMYVVSKTDGLLHPEESRTIEQVLQQETYGEIALYTFQMKETYKNSLEEAYQFAFRRFKENRKDFDPETRRKFLSMLQQVAFAHKGISRKEEVLLKRCRRDIDKI